MRGGREAPIRHEVKACAQQMEGCGCITYNKGKNGEATITVIEVSGRNSP
jgi:hypothetical protein